MGLICSVGSYRPSKGHRMKLNAINKQFHVNKQFNDKWYLRPGIHTCTVSYAQVITVGY